MLCDEHVYYILIGGHTHDRGPAFHAATNDDFDNDFKNTGF